MTIIAWLTFCLGFFQSMDTSKNLSGAGPEKGIGREHNLPSEKMGEATPPEDESKPFLLKIILLIDQ